MLIQKIKIALDCKTGRELAKKLGVHDAQISRLKKTGFHGEGTQKLIELLLEKIEDGKASDQNKL